MAAVSSLKFPMNAAPISQPASNSSKTITKVVLLSGLILGSFVLLKYVMPLIPEVTCRVDALDQNGNRFCFSYLESHEETSYAYLFDTYCPVTKNCLCGGPRCSRWWWLLR